MSQFCCLFCWVTFANAEDASQHKCTPPLLIKKDVVSFEMNQRAGLKRTRWGRIQDKLLSWDIGWFLAFMGLVIMNCVLVMHMNLTLTESFIEALSLGLAIPRLLNKE